VSITATGRNSYLNTGVWYYMLALAADISLVNLYRIARPLKFSDLAASSSSTITTSSSSTITTRSSSTMATSSSSTIATISTCRKRDTTGQGRYPEWEYFDAIHQVIVLKHSTGPPVVLESLLTYKL